MALLLSFPGALLAQEEESKFEKKSIIVLVGDSTVTDQAGWGKAFAKLMTSDAVCHNLSAGGRSSRSFRTEGRWQKCLDLKPNFVLIQFGHNDQPGKGPQRETDPETTYRGFMKAYVQEARAAGAMPILVTSLTRRQFDEREKIQSTLLPYVAAVQKLGAEMQVPVVDLHSRSIVLCEELGPAGCIAISPAPTENGADRTHLNEKGAKLMAELVVDELRRVVPQLAPYFATTIEK